MNCKEIQDLFIAYQMQDISNEDKDLIENHIKSCNTCEEELQKTISFMTDLNSIENEIPSFKIKENFEILLQEEIEKETVKVIPLKEKKDWKKWLKNLGIGGIIFFTVKGLITTYLIFMAGKCALN